MSNDRSPRKKRKKRHLLTAVALSTGSMMAGCGSQQGDADPGQGAQGEVREVQPIPMPANPKGSVYDEGLHPNGELDPVEPEEVEPTTDEPTDEPATDEPTTDEPRPHKALPLPANPKGALYDDGPYRASDDDEA